MVRINKKLHRYQKSLPKMPGLKVLRRKEGNPLYDPCKTPDHKVILLNEGADLDKSKHVNKPHLFHFHKNEESKPVYESRSSLAKWYVEKTVVISFLRAYVLPI